VHTRSLQPWQHDHAFGQGVRRAGERRTLLVALLTAAMMVVEVAAGITFGSMALLADGLHMASHAAALALAVAAYVYARRHAHDRRFTFGTGKVNALAGYSSAVVLAMFALLMVWESGNRLLLPQPIDFDQAILVACLGLAVNLSSMLLLHGEPHSHAAADADHSDTHDHDHGHDHQPTDHNLRGAYLHVLADALTSVLAIVSLGAGSMVGWSWPDAVVGLLGAVLVGRWALGLARDSGSVLLDREAPAAVREQIRRAIETDDSRVADLHVWSVGMHGYAAALSVVAHRPRSPEDYKARLPVSARVVHATVEVHRCKDHEDPCGGARSSRKPVRFAASSPADRPEASGSR
jgi:cation diffusion facilitator family transporter